jgi:hypothetical protein
MLMRADVALFLAQQQHALPAGISPLCVRHMVQARGHSISLFTTDEGYTLLREKSGGGSCQ